MSVRPVDPRDQRWEVDSPVFRVYFWEHTAFRGDVSYEYEITGADVGEVLRWAEDEAGDRTFVLYVCHTNERGELGLILLAGTDPTRG